MPIYVSYFNKEKMTYTFGKPELYSELKNKFNNRREIAEYLVAACNELYSI